MPDDIVSSTAVVEPTPETPPVVAPPVEEPLDDNREPGGDDPQAVRARKEYRLRKRLESELNVMQQEKIAADARMRTLEELHKPKADKPRVYTTQELQTAIDAGTISVTEAADYLAEQRAKQTADRVLKEERARIDDEYRTSLAQQKIDSYTELLPWLRDKTDSRRRPLENEYSRLMREYRLPDNLDTEALLLEKQFGSIESLKAKVKLDTDSRSRSDVHVESGAGGNVTAPRSGQKPDLAKIPKHFHEYWDKAQTPLAEREKDALQYWKREASKKQ